jgi:hypothetical protein
VSVPQFEVAANQFGARAVVTVSGELVGRKVHSFVSALDPDKAIAYEIFLFEPTG